LGALSQDPLGVARAASGGSSPTPTRGILKSPPNSSVVPVVLGAVGGGSVPPPPPPPPMPSLGSRFSSFLGARPKTSGSAVSPGTNSCEFVTVCWALLCVFMWYLFHFYMYVSGLLGDLGGHSFVPSGFGKVVIF
jgi:hypothetical protein